MKRVGFKRIIPLVISFLVVAFCAVNSFSEATTVSGTAQFARWHQSAFGSAWYQNDAVYDLIEAKDGGFVAGGSVYAWENHAYAVHANIIKYAKNGAIEWNKVFGCGKEGNGANAHFYKVVELSNGDILAAGDTNDTTGISVKDYANFFVVRLDSKGNIKWQKAFGVSQKETSITATGVVENQDGSLAIIGVYANKYNYTDFGYPIFTEIVLDSQGNVIEKYIISDDQPKSVSNASDPSIRKLSDNGYIVNANYALSGVSWTGVISKLDQSGKMIWGKYICPKDSTGNAKATSKTVLVEVSDGIIVASISYLDSVSKLFVYKLDMQGSVVWSKLISNMTLSNNISDPTIYLGKNNNVLVSVMNGYSTVDFTVLNISSLNGGINWVKSYGNKTGFERNYGGNVALRLLDTGNNLIGSGSNIITKLSKEGDIAFSSDDFTVQKRADYKIADAEIIKADAGYWQKSAMQESDIGEKAVSYKFDGAAKDGTIVVEQFKEPTQAQVSGNNLTISWSAISGAVGYKVYRSEAQGDYEDKLRTDFPIETTSFTDDQVDKDVKYFYIVRPVMKDGSLGQSVGEFSGIVSSKPSRKIVLQVNNPQMEVDGVMKELDPGKGTKPLIISGRTVLPIRSIVEAMGGTISWDGSTQKILLVANGVNVTMWVGKKEISVDGVNKKIDVAPLILNGRTMVPLRFAAENLKCKVDWQDTDKKITITY